VREPRLGIPFHPRTNVAFQTQQISSHTLTGSWSPCVFQLHSMYALYSSSSRLSCGSRSESWTHVF
jgi:hypothetical protein